MASAKARGKLPETPNLTTLISARQSIMGAKKLVIKNLCGLHHHAPNDSRYYEQVLASLRDALHAMLEFRSPGLPLERLYRGVEDLCRRGAAAKIYAMIVNRVEDHLRTVLLPGVRKSVGQSNIDVLMKVLIAWNRWTQQSITIRSTFSYLDRTYLLRESLPSINGTMIAQFRQTLFPVIKKPAAKDMPAMAAMNGICRLIDRDRQGNGHENANLLKESIRMLYVLGIYVNLFEPMFLKKSRAYFEYFAVSKCACSLKDYISACETLLDVEGHRCIALNLESTSKKQLMEIAHSVLIHRSLDKLLNGESLSQLFFERDFTSMKRLYDLLALCDAHSKMRDAWSQYISTTGTAIVSDKERGGEMVPRLLDLRRTLSLMIRVACRGNKDLVHVMDKKFREFMNDKLATACWETGRSKIGEMIAKHVDTLLRGGIKFLPKKLLSEGKDRVTAERAGQAYSANDDAELDLQLEQTLGLFRFIEGKGAFEAFYKKDLARRLLMSRSASQDSERSMLTKLRGECGSDFTHNLEQMFKDQQLARDEMASYRQWADATSLTEPPVELHVLILCAAAWPSYPDVRLNVPDEVAAQIERFEGHYKIKHTGRLLTWKHLLAHCSLIARFPKGTKELLVSAFQAVVLLLFNNVHDDEFLTHEQISIATSLQDGELERTLQSLACGKVRVLTKHPKGREVKPSDTFTLNKTFTDPKYRVKINQIQLKETKEENKATHERVVRDRRFETQATIVRIMKNRKHLGHAELVAEVINLTKQRGSIEPAAIKKEIERSAAFAFATVYRLS